MTTVLDFIMNIEKFMKEVGQKQEGGSIWSIYSIEFNLFGYIVFQF